MSLLMTTAMTCVDVVAAISVAFVVVVAVGASEEKAQCLVVVQLVDDDAISVAAVLGCPFHRSCSSHLHVHAAAATPSHAVVARRQDALNDTDVDESCDDDDSLAVYHYRHCHRSAYVVYLSSD